MVAWDRLNSLSGCCHVFLFFKKQGNLISYILAHSCIQEKKKEDDT